MVKKVSIWSVLEPLFYDDKIHLSELSRILKKPHTTIRKQLKYFENKKIVFKEIIGRQTFYSLNKKHPLIIEYLSIVEKERVIFRIEKNNILKELIQKLHSLNNTIILFGSLVENDNFNDVDIVIIGKFRKSFIKNLEDFLNLKFHIINIESLENINVTLKKEILKKHLIINNVESVIKWLLN